MNKENTNKENIDDYKFCEKLFCCIFQDFSPRLIESFGHLMTEKNNIKYVVIKNISYEMRDFIVKLLGNVNNMFLSDHKYNILYLGKFPYKNILSEDRKIIERNYNLEFYMKDNFNSMLHTGHYTIEIKEDNGDIFLKLEIDNCEDIISKLKWYIRTRYEDMSSHKRRLLKEVMPEFELVRIDMLYRPEGLRYYKIKSRFETLKREYFEYIDSVNKKYNINPYIVLH